MQRARSIRRFWWTRKARLRRSKPCLKYSRCMVFRRASILTAAAIISTRRRRMVGTLQDRLIKELAKAGITEVAAANKWIREVYLPAHNARFAKPAAMPESAFVKADAAVLAETLCVQEERVVGRDNTVSFNGLKLQLPESPLRHHFVKARVRVHHYPDGALAVFHGPRCIARYDGAGAPAAAAVVPTPPSVTPCSPPSRRGLPSAEIAEGAER